jgi:hypothetical protein
MVEAGRSEDAPVGSLTRRLAVARVLERVLDLALASEHARWYPAGAGKDVWVVSIFVALAQHCRLHKPILVIKVRLALPLRA